MTPTTLVITEQERNVLLLAAQGLTDTVAGRHIGTCARTYRRRLVAVSAKLGARNRAHASALAVALGILTVEDLEPRRPIEYLTPALLAALAVPEALEDTGRIIDEKPTGVHAFEQNPAATQVSVCICGKWRDHHVHGADPCGCDACRTPEHAEEATDQ